MSPTVVTASKRVTVAAKKAGDNQLPAPTDADALCPGGTPLSAEDHDHAG